MIPVLWSFGPFHLYSYGLCIAVGVLVSLHLMKLRSRKDGFPGEAFVTDMVMTVLVWGFLGARIYYVVQNLAYFIAAPWKVFAIWEGGLVFYGGAIGFVLGFGILMRRKRLSFWKTLDFILPYGALTHGFGRIGCFLNGCCFGKLCDLPWAVNFKGLSGPVHPTQLYEAAYNFLLAAFLIQRRKRPHFEGQISLLYFLLYGLGRYLVEFLREPNWVWLGLTSNQWMSVFIMTAAFIFYKVRQKKVS